MMTVEAKAIKDVLEYRSKKIEQLTAALESAEAREAELRARVAELEGMVPKWVPDAEVKAPLVVMPMPFWRGFVLCSNAMPVVPKEEV